MPYDLGFQSQAKEVCAEDTQILTLHPIEGLHSTCPCS